MILLVFGLGYTADRFVARYRSRFGRVIGSATTLQGVAAIEARGIEARLFGPDGIDSRLRADMADAELLLVCVPPDETGDPVLNRFGEVIADAGKLAWIGYLSTIGVYGDHGGAWVDEHTPPAPRSGRSRQRLTAEMSWLELSERSGKPVHIFRLAGIYGPGRNALAALAEGTARRIVKPGQVFNRIHVDDIAQVLLASIERPQPGAIYNVADDEPAPADEVVAYAAALAGIKPPPEIPFDEAKLSPMAASFYGESKRASNRLIRQELGVELLYPNYREGLRALRRAGEGP